MPRALPPNPSLEQLRRQAKDLLKASRELNLQALLRIEQYLPNRADYVRASEEVKAA